MVAQDPPQFLAACDFFQHRNHSVAFAGIEQRQGAVMARHVAIQACQIRPRTATAERVDHQRQRDLVEPRVKFLTDQRLGAVIADGAGIIQKPRAERLWAGVKEPACVEIQEALPVVLRLGQIERVVKAVPEFIV
ncbi:MAG: hypothetical protein ACD_54C00616G0001 [uncultured bacterium]|nr:MAG: hypothetical protein ACD_54C00616G0001 [uncultured bacterium]